MQYFNEIYQNNKKMNKIVGLIQLNECKILIHNSIPQPYFSIFSQYSNVNNLLIFIDKQFLKKKFLHIFGGPFKSTSYHI